jgi:hypothetical protein
MDNTINLQEKQGTYRMGHRAIETTENNIIHFQSTPNHVWPIISKLRAFYSTLNFFTWSQDTTTNLHRETNWLQNIFLFL